MYMLDFRYIFAYSHMQETQHKIGLNDHALSVLERRFLLRDERGQLVEDPDGLFRRVARTIAAIDDLYGDFRRQESEEVFYDLMSSLRFLPNSPTLMNAGTQRGQLAGCFVLPIEDSMESIFGTLRDTALIQKSGGERDFPFHVCALAVITSAPREVFQVGPYPSCGFTTFLRRSTAWAERVPGPTWEC